MFEKIKEKLFGITPGFRKFKSLSPKEFERYKSRAKNANKTFAMAITKYIEDNDDKDHIMDVMFASEIDSYNFDIYNTKMFYLDKRHRLKSTDFNFVEPGLSDEWLKELREFEIAYFLAPDMDEKSLVCLISDTKDCRIMKIAKVI